ncbi:type II toxin-antitoxin system RatA family toxin [Verticiella sediminum]|uniref:Type II toxin-antitoxin system RatA family toxin n=1 Tax=Verticiella sediminum TaxID=1247510 RepID=A0A556ACQ2_9BURK|nr:type II toxin-antitoxin system RatA family toxin [Verticiella sediminum]TSH90658.1 type II toxin-antitoxin system RatA family toxin [Verticiella sediminum]
MHNVQRSVLVPYAPARMFELVADVESYPDFMPWCGGAQVLERTDDGMLASVTISFAGLRQSFTTRNTHDFPNSIHLTLVDGPFSRLDGHWEFQSLGDGEACKVVFTMEYAFAGRALELLVGPVFNRIATTFIDAFSQRAERLYGGAIS